MAYALRDISNQSYGLWPLKLFLSVRPNFRVAEIEGRSLVGARSAFCRDDNENRIGRRSADG
jgi:hypothetical protein